MEAFSFGQSIDYKIRDISDVFINHRDNRYYATLVGVRDFPGNLINLQTAMNRINSGFRK